MKLHSFEVEDLASLVCGLDMESEPDAIDEALSDKFGIGFDQFRELIEALLPYTIPAKSAILEREYHGFVHEGCFVLKVEAARDAQWIEHIKDVEAQRDDLLGALEMIAKKPLRVEYPGHHNGAAHHRCPSCGYRWAVGIEAEEHSENCERQIAVSVITKAQASEPAPIFRKDLDKETDKPPRITPLPAPKRAWVGLTLEDRERLRTQFGSSYPSVLVDAIEDKLKELNHGN